MKAWTDTLAKKHRTAMPVTAMLALTACVTESLFVDLGYPPEKEQYYAGLDSTGISAAGLRSRSLILVVIDEREEKDPIGVVNTGLVFESHSYVHTDDNIALWVYDSVVHELGLFDYQVVDAHVAGGDEAVDQLRMIVTRVNSSCYFTCEASVSLAASLITSDGEVVSAEVIGTEGKAGLPGRWESLMEEALRRALQESIRTTLLDFGFVTEGRFGDADMNGSPN